MIRKQLYIEEYQEKALKRKAKELGISEAELMRQALDNVLRDADVKRPATTRALDELFTIADDIAKKYRLEADEAFDRQSLYEEDDRQRRWG